MTRHMASCQCGAVTALSDADPDLVLACNCKACQMRTGSPYGAGMYFHRADLTLSGETKTWGRIAESGRKVENHFCPECGTCLYWTLEFRPDHVGVAYGCFRTPAPEPMRAIWMQEKHDWVHFPGDMPTLPAGSKS